VKKIAFLPIFALIFSLVVMPSQVQGQATFENLGTFEPGDLYTGSFEFTTGGEIYVFAMNLSVDCTIGSGNKAIFHTFGSTPDTEIALYGPDGYTLTAGNDDGESGRWGDPGLQSLMYFGVNRVGNQDEYTGNTVQGDPVPWPTELSAGDYILILCSYSTVWDMEDARRSGFDGTNTGTANLTIMVR
jgi:hypothetical protein